MPLRDRREDLGLLVRAILRRVAPEASSSLTLHPRVARAFFRYEWPGNVRELERCLATAAVLAAKTGRIEVEHLPQALQRSLEPTADRREELVALLREHGGNIAAVARAMGKARMQIQRWMKRYGLDSADFRR
jgi:transcriptional regulator with GAF, ATPase, and Fis domain